MVINENLDLYRKEFNIVNSHTYLNHAANSPDSRRMRNKIDEFLSDTQYGNLRTEPWFDYAEQTRCRLAKCIGAEPDEITYVQNVSLAAGLIANGIFWHHGDNVVTTSNQFPSNIYPWLNLQRRNVEVRLIELPRDESCYDVFFDKVDSNTRLISLCFVEYDDGFRHDLKRVGEFCKKNNILFFVDGAQGVGALQIDVKEYNIDFLATTGVKWLLGPDGQGFLFVRKELLNSLYVNSLGWHSVETPYDFQNLQQLFKNSALKFEGGGINLLGIAGLGTSVELLLEVGFERIENQILALTHTAAQKLAEKGYTIKSNTADNYRSGILSFCHKTLSALTLFEILQSESICVSERNGAIRISPHFYNNLHDIQNLIDALPEV